MSSSARTALLKSVLPDAPHVDAAIARVVEGQPPPAAGPVPADVLQKAQLANALADISDDNKFLVERVISNEKIGTLRDVALLQAMIVDIWKFIDSSTSSDKLSMSIKASLLLSTDINFDKTLISKLTTEEHKELKTRQEKQKNYNREYDKHRLALKSLLNLIYKSVLQFYYMYLLEKYMIYNMLTALKQCIAFTDRACQIEYFTQYQKLKKALQN
ncbi:MAG: hypothetical protein M1813_006436 [Trichoglossum hirsutum]|nr:MAG: hypothetical protein M1813_007448 [Trichoglossum hirsutum]KAI9859893.1 MAG: hypothetical protein M1813_006436 [Trichoglossum hirsutum]